MKGKAGVRLVAEAKMLFDTRTGVRSMKGEVVDGKLLFPVGL